MGKMSVSTLKKSPLKLLLINIVQRLKLEVDNTI
jgi:hypothetical protein